ncbi:Putative LOC100168714, partial [Caligus rogercresseyi]
MFPIAYELQNNDFYIKRGRRSPSRSTRKKAHKMKRPKVGLFGRLYPSCAFDGRCVIETYVCRRMKPSERERERRSQRQVETERSREFVVGVCKIRSIPCQFSRSTDESCLCLVCAVLCCVVLWCLDVSSLMSDPVSEDLLRVGHYELSSTLGKGNFSLVRLGVHVLTGVEVAVKIVAKSKLDAESASKMRREIQILRSLSSHPHIIRLFQVMESPSGIYMVTEHAQKGEIFDYIAENGRLPEDKAAKWFAQILSAVGHLHGLGIVHRDLKAENLLLDEHQNVKLADFGFSNFYSSGVLLSTWCGSPPYAAPELFEGKAYVGPKADIWSLGVVLYVLVSGSLPFDAPTLHELKARVLSCQYRVPFFLSSHCEDLLKGLL